jgi:hypothetical protein
MQSAFPRLAIAALLTAVMSSPCFPQETKGGGGLIDAPDIMVMPKSAKARQRPATAAPSSPQRHAKAPVRRRKRVGSGSPIVPPPVPIGPAPSQPGVPAYRPPTVQVPASPSFCVTRGQSFNPSTGYQTGAGICP